MSPGEAVDHDHNRAGKPGTLPRRERASLRGARPGRRGDDAQPAQSPQEQSAARRAFADDLAAFSLGSQDSAGKGPTS